jgi:membrane protease YdiL (CAAX protease family)
MSTTDARARRIAWWAGIVCALAAALGLAAVLDAVGERDTAAGVLTGGLLVVALILVARWRSRRNATSAATASRVAGGAPDERDAQVLQRTMAVVGVAALLASSLGVVVMFLDVDAEVVLGSMPWVLLVTAVVTFVVVDRRS